MNKINDGFFDQFEDIKVYDYEAAMIEDIRNALNDLSVDLISTADYCPGCRSVSWKSWSSILRQAFLIVVIGNMIDKQTVVYLAIIIFWKKRLIWRNLMM